MSDFPTEEEVLGYFDTLSNWGRWGEDDQMGTLNHITPEKTKQAVGLVEEGVTVCCSRPITYETTPDQSPPPLHYMIESGEGWASGDKVSATPNSTSKDFIGMAFHGHTITHIDSLAHIFWGGKMYNGRPAHLVSTSLGATVESVDLVKDSIVTRGVLVDVPLVRNIDWLEVGEWVTPQDIEAAEERCGFRIGEGDALLIRTGWLKRREAVGPLHPHVSGSVSPHAACLPLFRERDIALMGSDSGNDAYPNFYSKVRLPIHQVGMVAMGLWLVDHVDTEDLAQACRARNRWEFLFCVSPIRITNGTGAPVNPVAIF